jgi:hypothetical protein
MSCGRAFRKTQAVEDCRLEHSRRRLALRTSLRASDHDRPWRIRQLCRLLPRGVERDPPRSRRAPIAPPPRGRRGRRLQPVVQRRHGWIAFGVALGILGLTGVAQRDRGRGIVQSALDVVILPLAAWSAIASVIFRGSTLTWLSFGDALGFVGLGVVGLIAHELSTERVVHSLAPARSRESTMKAAA